MKTVTQFSKEIGISRQTVYRKIKQLGLLQELQKNDNVIQLELQHENILKRALNIDFEEENTSKSYKDVTEELQKSDSYVTELIET